MLAFLRVVRDQNALLFANSEVDDRLRDMISALEQPQPIFEDL
jgi:hypothetical protein